MIFLLRASGVLVESQSTLLHGLPRRVSAGEVSLGARAGYLLNDCDVFIKMVSTKIYNERIQIGLQKVTSK